MDSGDIIRDSIESDFSEEFDDITLQQILNALIKGDKNLDLKTEIHSPKSLAGLKVLALFLKNKKFEASSELIEGFIEHFLRYMFSYKRQSRKEIVNAFRSSMESLKTTISLGDKVLSNLKNVT